MRRLGWSFVQRAGVRDFLGTCGGLGGSAGFGSAEGVGCGSSVGRFLGRLFVLGAGVSRRVGFFCVFYEIDGGRKVPRV